MPRLMLLLVLLVVGLSSCRDLMSVSRGGTVVVVVADNETQTGISGITTTLSFPDASTGASELSQVTNAGGEATFEFDQAGRVTVSVAPPEGYTEGATGLTRELAVNRGETLTVVFLLVKQG